MPASNRSHTFSFSFNGEPTVDELINELKVAAEVCGGAAKAHITAGSGQRDDGYYFNAQIQGSVPR